MLDLEWLRERVAATHLEPETIAAYRRSFAAQTGPHLSIDDFLPDALAAAVSRFLAEEARFRASYGLYHHGGEVTREVWEAAEDEARFYRYRVLDEGQWRASPSPAAAVYVGLRRDLADARFAVYVSALTGLVFGDGTEVGTHGMERGDFLHGHRDVGGTRRVAFLLYLAPGWRSAWGGTLHLLDADGTSTPIEPRYNRLLLFDVVANQGHHVDAIEDAAGARSRLSVGGWLHQPAHPQR